MRGLLIRVGIDHSYGHWNAPVDPVTKEFVYFPIPEGQPQKVGLETTYQNHVLALNTFCEARNLEPNRDLGFPTALITSHTHHDPDFSNFTYGDVGNKRGSQITSMLPGDFVVFYAGLRPTKPCQHKLLYAIIGIYIIDEVILARDILESRWNENAHTRRNNINIKDVIIRAKKDRYAA